MAKKRILFSGEASYLSTGFATFGREVISRLYKTGKYEIAECGSYGDPNNPEAKKIPWKFYSPAPLTKAELEHFNKLGDEERALYQFGRAKWNSIVSDFQPDIVFDPRDPWMFQHLQTSRFRDLYKLVLMPTVDSAPQRKEWIQGLFGKADALTTYSRYGQRVLQKEGLTVKAVTSPGVHLDVFKPLDRATVRDKFHISESLLIFGTVMRNQKRKLFPDLFDAYKRLRDRHVKKSLVKRAKEKVRNNKTLTKTERHALRVEHSVLYCHTSWPDNGWNIPEYIQRFQLQRHIIFTYKCDSCSEVYTSWFSPCDNRGMTTCRVCGKQSAHMPNTHSGVSEEDLVNIFNLFDVYLQPAICEGWGLPIMEAKACGVPGLYQNYSAMEDHVENGGGMPIKVERFYHEAETGATRSLPDVDDMVRKMEKLAFNDKLRISMSKEARRCAKKMHDWDVTAKKLENIFDEIEILDRAETWDKPPKLEYLTNQRAPNSLNDHDFIVWLYINVLKRSPDPQGFNDWMAMLAKGGNRGEVESFFRDQISSQNKFEEVRWRNSLKVRGMTEAPVEKIIQQRADIMPGVLL